MFPFVFILMLVACKSKTEDKNKNVASVNEIEVSDNADSAHSKKFADENKTFVVKGKSVIFFMLNQREINQLIKQSGDNAQWEFESLFNKFKFTASSLRSSLDKQHITTTITNAKYFEMQPNSGTSIKFDRVKEEQIMGQIFFDGVNKPRIEYGVFKGKELIEIVENYFKIKNIDYVEPKMIDSLSK